MPMTPRLAVTEGTAAVYESLRDLVPIIQGPPMPPFEVSNASQGSFALLSGPPRMLDRRRTLSVSLSPTAVVVETSAYSHFEEFAEVIERTMEALATAAQVAGIQRVGLRYIDEIRVDDVRELADWASYVNPSLLAGVTLSEGLTPLRTEGLAEFDIGNGQRTVMRFGAMRGWVADPSGPLRLRRSADGLFFLLDIDSFWQPGDEGPPEFSKEAVLDTCAKLREPIRRIFESSITEKLREEVLRKEVRTSE